MAAQSEIGRAHTRVYNDEYGFTYVKYHHTVVVRFDGKSVVLNSDGHKTNTTRVRMNQTAQQYNLPYKVIQSNFKWYVEIDKSGLFERVVDFKDKMEIEI